MAHPQNGEDARNTEPSVDENANTSNVGSSNYSSFLAWTQYWQYYYSYSFYYYSSYYYYLQCQQGQAQFQNISTISGAPGNVFANTTQSLPHTRQRIANGDTVGPTNVQPTVQVNTQQERYEYKVASIGRRAFAEFIDFVFLLFIKHLIYSLYYEDADQVSQIQFILVVDESTNLREIEDVLIQALFYRLVVFLYEAFFIALPFPCPVGGATLGKYMMGITVISYQGLTPVEGYHLRRFTATTPKRLHLWQACVRAVLKNFMITFFFPIMFTAMFLQNYRTPYDLVASSVVVEANPRLQRQS